jgi:hypothetical protein
MRKRLERVLSGMPCDNLDDPREVAQNEMFAEQANMELAEWAATVAAQPVESRPQDPDR